MTLYNAHYKNNIHIIFYATRVIYISNNNNGNFIEAQVK